MMKKLLIAVAAISLVPIACTQQPAKTDNTASAETPADAPAEGAAPVAVIGDASPIPIYTKTAGDKLAVSGFDPVAYFEGDGTPKQGSEEFKVLYNGYEYRFASKENAEKFAKEPEKYAPQYGGNCAWAAARGKLAPGNPQNYKIVDGKLYLNFSDTVQSNWEKDIPGFIEKANVEFPKFKPEQRYDDSDA